MYEIRNCAGQYSGKLHWKFLRWRNRDLERCSEINTNTPLLFLFLYNSVLLKMADTERRWGDSRNGCSLSPRPLQRGAGAGSGPLALPGKKAGPKGPAVCCVNPKSHNPGKKSPQWFSKPDNLMDVFFPRPTEPATPTQHVKDKLLQKPTNFWFPSSRELKASWFPPPPSENALLAFLHTGKAQGTTPELPLFAENFYSCTSKRRLMKAAKKTSWEVRGTDLPMIDRNQHAKVFPGMSALLVWEKGKER